MDILSAQICTSTSGIVVDAFRVIDRDFSGAVPAERIADIRASIRSVLADKTDVRTLFRKHRRYGAAHRPRPVSDLPMRVVMDNETSDRATIIDVFAHDRTGLLYTVTRALFELGLSVSLAKISTYFDQVVDVFYVTESTGQRLEDGERLRSVRDELTARITEFERNGWEQFVT
jgi:[protein-PII] uridylyltransferase